MKRKKKREQVKGIFVLGWIGCIDTGMCVYIYIFELVTGDEC